MCGYFGSRTFLFLGDKYLNSKETQFKHIISLGHFCSVASDLEKIGLRSESLPFDWLITPEFENVILAIENHFDGFLDEEMLKQSKKTPRYYKCSRYNFEFYHDFSEFKPLSVQLPEIRQKYKRRIDRLYKAISEPCLFIRYINDKEVDNKGLCKDITAIEKHYNQFISFLENYNAKSEVIFIANEGVSSDIIKIFNVKKDNNDNVCRNPIENSTQLYDYLESLNFEHRSRNLKRLKKNKLKRTLLNAFKKARRLIQSKICKVYIHNKRY